MPYTARRIGSWTKRTGTCGIKTASSVFCHQHCYIYLTTVNTNTANFHRNFSCFPTNYCVNNKNKRIKLFGEYYYPHLHAEISKYHISKIHTRLVTKTVFSNAGTVHLVLCSLHLRVSYRPRRKWFFPWNNTIKKEKVLNHKKKAQFLSLIHSSTWTFPVDVTFINVVIITRHEVGLDRLVSASSTSRFKGLPSRLRPFGLRGIIMLYK
jgi:hypothetical protein